MTDTLTLTPGTFQQSSFDKVGDGLHYEGIELTTTGTKTTFTAKTPLKLNPGTSVIGDGKALIQLISNAPPDVWKAATPVFYIEGDNYHFEGFSYNGNADNQLVKWGKGYQDLIRGTKSTNVTVTGVTAQNTLGDMVRLSLSSKINFNKNKIYGVGHDGLYVESCSDVEAFDNICYTRINSALRCRGSSDITFRNNWIYSTNKYTPRTGPGIIAQIDEAGSSSTNVQIYENWIEGTEGPGMWIVTHSHDFSQVSDISIHNNVIKNCGQMQAVNKLPGVAGISLDGWNAKIFDNTFDGCYGAELRIGNYITTSQGSGYVVDIRGNILTNTGKANYPDKYSGIGLVNIRDNHKITVDGNCFYNNVAGTHYGVKSTNEILKDPMYADAQYLLLASSPCIFSGYQLGRYNITSTTNTGEEDGEGAEDSDNTTEETPTDLLVACRQIEADDIVTNLSDKYTIYR